MRNYTIVCGRRPVRATTEEDIERRLQAMLRAAGDPCNSERLPPV